jgi:hypothetical protein
MGGIRIHLAIDPNQRICGAFEWHGGFVADGNYFGLLELLVDLRFNWGVAESLGGERSRAGLKHCGTQTMQVRGYF